MSLFTKEEMQSKVLSGTKILSCSTCKLYSHNITHPKLDPKGKFKRKILIVGEYTSIAEDHEGEYFKGKSGKHLLSSLKEVGIEKDDVMYVNAVRCLPLNKDKSRTPTNIEIDCCRVLLERTIEQLKPKMIILLGDIALQSVIGHRWKRDLGKIVKWRGFIIPDQTYKCWVAPIFSANYVTHIDKPEIDLIWKQDLKRIADRIDVELPDFKVPKINYHYDKDLSWIENIPNIRSITFDYESTGLKPHRKGHRILICSFVSIDKDGSIEIHTFKIPKDIKKCKPFLNLLTNPKIKKVGQNIKFENNWSAEIFGVVIQNWEWDTMLATHILDNRKGITSLKFQTFVVFGVADYASEVSPYLESEENKNANSFNRLLEYIKSNKANLKKVMKYCALDSYYTYLLRDVQKEEFAFYNLPF